MAEAQSSAIVPDLPPSLPGHVSLVFRAEDIFVAIGVNLDEGLGEPGDVVAGDIYALDERARPVRLVMTRPSAGTEPRVAEGSAIGVPGEAIVRLGRYTMMSPDGNRVEVMLLQVGGGHWVLPLAPLSSRTDYTLLQSTSPAGDTRLSDLMCISFCRATMITLADGRQRAIEELVVGDRVLTRDHGPQGLRWIGRVTLRAVGAFAPVVIARGTLGNASDLIVSQHHRIFLYQRKKLPGVATSELLVQAKHLVDGENVFLREGGFVDYFSLVFDRHEIIYAEGVPAESLMVTEATVARLPAEIAAEVEARFPGLTQVQHFGTEPGRQAVEDLGPQALYQPGRNRR